MKSSKVLPDSAERALDDHEQVVSSSVEKKMNPHPTRNSMQEHESSSQGATSSDVSRPFADNDALARQIELFRDMFDRKEI